MKTQNATTSEDNSPAVVTITGNAGEAIYITHIAVEFDNTVSDITVTIDDGGTTIWQRTISDRYGEAWDFSIPLKATAGNTVTITLGASGSAGTTGSLYVFYATGE